MRCSAEIRAFLLPTVLGALICILPGDASPAEPVSNGNFTARQRSLIKLLYSQNRYFDCIAETRRLLHYAPQTPDRDDRLYFIEVNYFLMRQFKSVIAHIREKTPHGRLRLPYLLLMSQAYCGIGEYCEGYAALKHADRSAQGDAERRELLARKVEILMRGSLYREALNEISACNSLLNSENQFRELSGEIENYTGSGRKSEALSIDLSAIVPGAGQVYAGRSADGLVSLAAVIATAAGAFYAYGHGEKGIAYTLVFFSSLFYAGNIYGAYNSAVRANTDRDAMFASTMIRKYIPPYRPLEAVGGKDRL